MKLLYINSTGTFGGSYAQVVTLYAFYEICWIILVFYYCWTRNGLEVSLLVVPLCVCIYIYIYICLSSPSNSKDYVETEWICSHNQLLLFISTMWSKDLIYMLWFKSLIMNISFQNAAYCHSTAYILSYPTYSQEPFL